MSLLLSPLSWLLLAALLLLLGQWLRALTLRLAGAAVLVVAWLAMTPLGANWLVGRIEHAAAPAPAECEGVDWLVLLAGGLERAPLHEDDGGALTTGSLQRVFALRARPPPPQWRHAISGGGPHALAEAEVMAGLLHQLDPSAPPPLLETASRSTWESARAMAVRLPPPRRIALASSALHLPRARLAFEAAGFEVCRWPLDRSFVAVGGPGAWLPRSSALRKSEAALHELVGALYYRWLAWGDAASRSA